MSLSLKAELETWANALKAYDAQDFDGALELFARVNDSSKILFNMGLIYATVGQHELAVEQFTAATQLDVYLAVAYFQSGVSNFLLGRFDVALRDFEEALLYLRGNQAINYEQIGLKFKLYSCEILFNRGLAKLNLGYQQDGLFDLREAAKEKVTDEHDVINEAIRDGGEGYTVFSIPVGVVYRPSEAKLKNSKAKDYMGKAKLVAASNDEDAFIEFTGVARKRIAMGEEIPSLGRSQTAPAPKSSPIETRPPISLDRANTTINVRTDSAPSAPSEPRTIRQPLGAGALNLKPTQPLVSRRSQSISNLAEVRTTGTGTLSRTESTISSFAAGQSSPSGSAVRPLGHTRSATATPATLSPLSFGSGPARRPPGPPAALQPGAGAGSPSNAMSRGMSVRRVLPAPGGSSSVPASTNGSPRESFATQPLVLPGANSNNNVVTRAATPPRELPKPPRQTDFFDDYINAYDSRSDATQSLILGPSSAQSSPAQDRPLMLPAVPRSQSPASQAPAPTAVGFVIQQPPREQQQYQQQQQQQPAQVQRALTRTTTAGGSLRRKPTRRTTTSRRQPSVSRSRTTVYEDEEEGYGSGGSAASEFELSTIRIKLFYQGDVRGMTMHPATAWEEFVERVTLKFGTALEGLGMQFMDEDGVKVSLRDESDFELAIETAREAGKGRPEGKLQVWCTDV
ncbi:hypothetical protein CONPUDRAFT_82858 [Coniophora puteana RWD-64-598 SS2]|uniref:PB1 domain-containing protein n=1 Tax=Coniophora puteana (strain RWD-64-598) TaxID=741705 RepID=A0A5M3MQP6_CONPW|nr:uncharacterized protein CONPUDRAFT_82858 [Coniophora puteana RWD-64-598 SS2]EIW80831.1 hypothetical protein CONPUDRAFT_82858 [Coniophora puteana RWD-64-598 SS2]